MVVARVPRHETFMKGTSHCENCGHALEQKDMVPIFSWLRLKGKCRYCGSPVSPEYTIVEALGGLAKSCIGDSLGDFFTRTLNIFMDCNDIPACHVLA